jgi:type IV pilus assembly protein PilQ
MKIMRTNKHWPHQGAVCRGKIAATLLRFVPDALAALLTPSVWGATIEGVEFSSLPGDKTEIRVQFDGPPPQPNGYTIERPARIVLDMPGVDSNLEEKHHTLGIGNARRVSIVSTKDRTRAIVNLTRLVSYETSIQGNTLYVLVGADGSGAGAPATAQAPSFSSGSRSAAGGDSAVTGVDFRRGSQGEGRSAKGLFVVIRVELRS